MALMVLLVCLGCHLKSYQYTDPKYKITVTYPGDINLIKDQEQLNLASSASPDAGELVFVLQTQQRSTLSCSVHQVPGEAEITADTYYEATTARELKSLEAVIVEPKTEVLLDGRTFQKVGFTLTNPEQDVRVQLYQHYDPKSRRVLVLSPITTSTAWEQEIKSLEPLLQGIKFDW